jgi:hypothetical protein
MNRSKQILHPSIRSNLAPSNVILPSKSNSLITNGIMEGDDLELTQLRELSDLLANCQLVFSIRLLEDLRVLLIPECHVCNEIVVENLLAVGERDGLEAFGVGFGAANVLAGEGLGST